MSRKELGCCTLCDKQVFEVLEYYAEGHPLQGRIRRLSQVLSDPDARRVSLLQYSSPECGIEKKIMDPWKRACVHEVTLCAKCRIDHTNIVALWRKCMESYAEVLTRKHQKHLGKPEATDEQQDYSEKVAMWMVSHPPIGVIHEQKWSEVAQQ